jgi:signal transduction histidine kinase
VVLAVLDINRRKEIEKKLANNAELLEKQVLERTTDLETKAKELEESNALLEKAQKTANEANEAKSKFLTNVSSELKTPINAIIGYGEILQEEALDRKDTVSADDLRKIIGSAKHLLSLVDEILDLSKIEAGKIQLFFENVDVHGIIKDVEGVTMPLITKNNNSLFLEYTKNIGVMYTDALKLRQCLLNLLSNAAKFTEFGKITLRASAIVKQGIDYIEFSIIDTGIGIDPDRISGIFDPFQDSGKKSGAGLGLSITKKYAKLLGGTISAESESGVGSKFTMRIPKICTVEANEFIEIKNQSSDEIIDEFKEEYIEEEIAPATEEPEISH